MKKLFFGICLMSLIFALCGISTFATTENPAEPETNEIGNVSLVVETPEREDEHAESIYSGWIEKITDSTMWINVGTVAIACLGIIGTVGSKFKNIADLISKKADANTVIDTVKHSVGDICDSFKTELTSVKDELSVTKENEEKLFAILTIFITNAKINSTAKAEIMNYVTGIKKMNGSIEEIVTKANEAIEAAKEAEEKAETPALDAITAETATPAYMELG